VSHTKAFVGDELVMASDDRGLGHACVFFDFSNPILLKPPVIGSARVKGNPASYVRRATWVLVPLICKRKRANAGNERDGEMQNPHDIFGWLSFFVSDDEVQGEA
jgi:hypothetical protein